MHHRVDRVLRDPAPTELHRGAQQIQQTSDGLGFSMWDEDRIIGVVTLDVAAGAVTDVRLMMNPAKLTLWHGSTMT